MIIDAQVSLPRADESSFDLLLCGNWRHVEDLAQDAVERIVGKIIVEQSLAADEADGRRLDGEGFGICKAQTPQAVDRLADLDAQRFGDRLVRLPHDGLEHTCPGPLRAHLHVFGKPGE